MGILLYIQRKSYQQSENKTFEMGKLGPHLVHARFVNLPTKIILPINMGRAHEALSLRLKLANIAYYFCRNAGNDFSSGNIFCHDRACTYNGIVSNGNTRQND